MIEIIQEVMKAGPTVGGITLAIVILLVTMYYRIQKRITLTLMILVDVDVISLGTLEKYKLLEIGLW